MQDIEDTVVSASADGVTIKYVVMRKDRFALLKKQKAVIEKVKGWINQKEKLTISKKVINEYLSAQENTEGVQIVLVSPAVRIEDASHNRTTINPWEAAISVFWKIYNAVTSNMVLLQRNILSSTRRKQQH